MSAKDKNLKKRTKKCTQNQKISKCGQCIQKKKAVDGEIGSLCVL